MTMMTKRARSDTIILEIISIVLGILIGGFLNKFLYPILEKILISDPQPLYAAIVSLQGALLGFVLAALAIILGYSNAPQLRILREAGQLPNLFRVYIAGIQSHATVTIIALIALMIKPSSSLSSILAWTVTLTFTLASYRLCRTLWATRQVVKNVSTSISRKPAVETTNDRTAEPDAVSS